MQYRKGDLPKIIVLSAILLGLFVYIGVSYSKGMRRMRAQLDAAHQAMYAAQEAQVRAGAGGSSVALRAEVPPPSRDPFDPIIPPRNIVRANAQAAQARQKQSMATLPTLPPLGGSEAPGRRTGESDTIQLTGIIVGPPSIAVMRRGDQHYIVQQGDVLEGDLRVDSVGRSSVTLRGRQGSYTLRLGD